MKNLILLLTLLSTAAVFADTKLENLKCSAQKQFSTYYGRYIDANYSADISYQPKTKSGYVLIEASSDLGSYAQAYVIESLKKEGKTLRISAIWEEQRRVLVKGRLAITVNLTTGHTVVLPKGSHELGLSGTWTRDAIWSCK